MSSLRDPFAMRGLLTVLLVPILLSGCASPPDAADAAAEPTPEPAPAAEALPTPMRVVEPGPGPHASKGTSDVRTWLLDPTEWGEGEAYVAAHPTDPRVVAVTGQAWRPGGWRVFCFVTTDGGESWRRWDATPAGRVLPTEDLHLFDPSAAFGHDGALHVLYGQVERGPHTSAFEGAPLAIQVVHARSDDLGATWRAQALPSPNVAPSYVADYMTIAAAPDEPRVYAVANVPGVGPWFWRSEDGGASWATPTLLRPVETKAEPRTLVNTPHVAAGKEGAVAVAMRAPGDLVVATSVDGGATFDGWRVAVDTDGVSGVTRGLVLRGAPDAPLEAHLAVGARHAVARAEAATADFGKAEEAARLDEGRYRWLVVAGGADNRTAALGSVTDDGGTGGARSWTAGGPAAPSGSSWRPTAARGRPSARRRATTTAASPSRPTAPCGQPGPTRARTRRSSRSRGGPPEGGSAPAFRLRARRWEMAREKNGVPRSAAGAGSAHFSPASASGARRLGPALRVATTAAESTLSSGLPSGPAQASRQASTKAA